MGLLALIFVLVVLVVIALFSMKLIPSYLEYRAAKHAIDAIARDKQSSSVADIRRAFENRSTIDDITAVKAQDLEISKDASGMVIGFAYRKEVPLLPNVGLYIDYTARAGGQ
ncbi:MAG: DUF4845 domain-containing protein [Burkholderiales bacterium]